MYVTKSAAGHDLEDELARIAGRPYDWYEPLLTAAIEGELQVSRADGREMGHQAGEWPDCSPLLCGHPAGANPQEEREQP